MFLKILRQKYGFLVIEINSFYDGSITKRTQRLFYVLISANSLLRKQ
jgi:hypothetical protein